MIRRFGLLFAVILMLYTAPLFASEGKSQKAPIVIGTELANPPYSFIDENGKATGYNVDLTRAIAQVMQLDIELKIGPWGEIRKALESGKIDAVSGMFYSAERDKLVDFSPPYTITQHAIFVRRDAPVIKASEDIHGKDIIVMRGNIMHDYVLENGLCEKPVLVDTQAEALRLLASGKHECALVAKSSGLYWSKELGLSNIVTVGPMLCPSEYGYAVIEGNAVLLGDLVKGLSIIKQTGEYNDIYDKWLGVLQPPGISAKVILKYITIVMVPFVLLLAGSVLWSQSLKKQVTQKTEELETERDKLRGVLNGIGKGMYIVNRDFVVEYSNAMIANRFPGSIGMKCYVGFFELDKPCEFCFMRDAVKSDKILHTEAVLKDDAYFDIIFSPFTDIDGSIKTIVLMRDITEMKILQAESMRSGHLASIGELAAGVAHEINNPLNGIISCAEILRDQFKEHGEDTEIPIRIIDTGKRVAAIVKNLLNFARDHEDDFIPVDVKEILSDTLALIEKQICKDGIKLTVDVPADLPKIKAHRYEIQQVFLNLISNARYAVNSRIQNSDEDKFIKIESGIIEFEESRCIRMIFHDNGTGITENILEKICNPFFTTKPAGSGTGLGLNISHGIINNHNGKLLFESVEGKFTKVIVDLPVYNELEI